MGEEAMGEEAKNCMSLLYSLQVQDRTTWYLQHNGMTNSEMKMCLWK